MTDTASIVRIYTGVKGDKGDPGVADDASVAALVADPESATGAQLESTFVTASVNIHGDTSLYLNGVEL